MRNSSTKTAPQSGPVVTKRDPDGVREDILQVAVSEFAEKGLSGARVDDIASKTKTSKRMIYYYFGDKVGLYQRCLELAYARVREGEAALQLDDLDPMQALEQLVDFTVDHHAKNSDFVRLIMIENVHQAQYLNRSEALKGMNLPIIRKLETIIQKGQDQGLFRSDLNPLHLHWKISALSFFNVSNRNTFSAVFGGKLFEAHEQEELKSNIVRMIQTFVKRV